MKFLSKAALATALIATAGGMTIATPAFAKKEEKPKGDGLKLSAPFRAKAIAAQTAVEAKDFATAEPLLAELATLATESDDKYLLYGLRLKLETSRSPINEAALAAPLDGLIANPRTPPAEAGRLAYYRANIHYNAKQYPQALALYAKAKSSGYTTEDLPLQVAKAKILSGDSAGGVADIEAAVAADKAAGRPVSEDLYRYAITTLQAANDPVGTQRWTRNWLHAYGTPKNWRTAIYVFGFQGVGAKRIDNKQRIDLFRLMRATNALADQADYLEYADTTVKIGLASEALTVVKEGRANTKIPASSTNATEIAADATRQLSTEGSLASQEAKAKASPTGKLAADTGDFCLGNGTYAKAIEMYKLALQKGSVDADAVNTHLGIAYANSGDKASAKLAFAEVKMAPRNEIATLWTTWVDAPAGAASAS